MVEKKSPYEMFADMFAGHARLGACFSKYRGTWQSIP